MNPKRILVSAVAAFLVFFTYGFLVHGRLIAKDYRPYPEGVYRAGEAAQSHMPIGLLGVFVAILVFTTIYARSHKDGQGVKQGARLGFLFGIFMAGAFVAVNYATINISAKLAVEMAISEPVEWTLVGIVVGSLYKPLVPETRT